MEVAQNCNTDNFTTIAKHNKENHSTTAQPQQKTPLRAAVPMQVPQNFNTDICATIAKHNKEKRFNHSSTTAKSQYYYSFVRSTRTKPREGCSGHVKIAILLQFRAIDTHETTRGLIREQQNRNITTVSCDRHARNHERVAPHISKSQYFYSFVRSTRTIHCKTQGFANENRTRAAEKTLK